MPPPIIPLETVMPRRSSTLSLSLPSLHRMKALLKAVRCRSYVQSDPRPVRKRLVFSTVCITALPGDDGMHCFSGYLPVTFS